METTAIRYEVADGVATITLNRPDKLNAYNRDMGREIIAAFDEADRDDAVRAIIVTGAGRAFCAGADLSGGAKTFDYAARGSLNSADLSDDSARDGGGRLTLRIFECLKPVIAAINGPAVGIGATMLLPMDIRLASDTARFGFVFARRGVVMEACSSWFLPRLVGIANAVDLCYSGRLISAAEAHEKGLVQSVHAPGALIDAAIAKAREMTADSAPVSVALTRHMLWRMMGAPHPIHAHRWDSRVIFSRGRSPDAAEGVMSFLEKRPPNFTASVANDYPWFDEFEDTPPYS